MQKIHGWVASRTPPTGDPAGNPGLYPDREAALQFPGQHSTHRATAGMDCTSRQKLAFRRELARRQGWGKKRVGCSFREKRRKQEEFGAK